jgi:DNA (cytosine-5)-methyltransferase 1
MEKLTHLSLFTGIGGIDIAAEAAGFATVAQCENAAFPLAVLEKHWPDIPRFSDINTLTKERFIEKTGLSTITLISGGFPCQPFSQAGKRRGFADERHLWPEMFRVIRELRPRWVVGENVAGFVNVGLDQTMSDLEDTGYCVRAFLIPACAVGAWHERKRIFIIAADVSDTDCLRQRKGRGKTRLVYDTGRSDTQEGERRYGLERETIGSCIFSNTDGVGRDTLNAETVLIAERKRIWQPCGTDGAQGKSRIGQRGAQSLLGGVADGLPSWLDGHRLWETEPEAVPRMTEEKKNLTERLAALGNAVVPQQVYPILKYIADMENSNRGGVTSYERTKSWG